jgi:hypothetical protein
MAFTLTDDHARQHEVWAQLSWNKSPEMIRKLLTQSHVSPSDRRVRFVGAEAYEAAGGIILRDLFVEDHGGYFTDSELLGRLVLEKLEATGEGVAELEVGRVTGTYNFVHTLRCIYLSQSLSPKRRPKLDELVTGMMRSPPSTARMRPVAATELDHWRSRSSRSSAAEGFRLTTRPRRAIVSLSPKARCASSVAS